MRGVVLCFLLGLLALPSAGKAAEESGRSSGLPIPRFVTLRSGEVNLRTGPGTRYPIDWVFKRKYMPVEITAEYDVWRKVRDVDGAEGWVHQSTLSGKRGFVTVSGTHDLVARPDILAAPVARLQQGVIGEVLSCGPVWCKVTTDGYKGYLQKGTFWGAYGEEVFE
jgi:SH3-like domain-containing protein